MTDFRSLLEALAKSEVEFILVGGVAATIHGSARLTADLDIVYRRSADNIGRLVRALRDHRPYLRGAPPGLAFRLDEAPVSAGLDFPLTTELGDIDLMGEITGGGSYEALQAHTVEVTLFNLAIRCIDLPTLIRVKRAAGRPRDLEVVAELELILAEIGRKSPD
jgi:hypothetical protein